MSPELNCRAIGPMEASQAAEQQAELLREEIPDEVFDVFNRQIARKLRNGRAKVLQKDVVAELNDQGFSSSELFDKHWLDVEPCYKEAGWQVKYEQPIYWGGEDFEAYFEFRTGKNG